MMEDARNSTKGLTETGLENQRITNYIGPIFNHETSWLETISFMHIYALLGTSTQHFRNSTYIFYDFYLHLTSLIYCL